MLQDTAATNGSPRREEAYLRTLMGNARDKVDKSVAAAPNTELQCVVSSLLGLLSLHFALSSSDKQFSLLFVESDPAQHSWSVSHLKLLSAELKTKSYYLVTRNVRGDLSRELL